MSSVILPGSVYPGRTKNPGNHSGVKKIERIFTGFIILLLGIIILELGFHFLIAPSVMIEKIIISTESNFPYSDDYLMKVAGISRTDTFFDINTALVGKRLMLVPSIRSVSVKKVFPSIVKIDIDSRVPVGISLIAAGDGVVPALIDDEGVVYMAGSDLVSLDLPVISGLDFPEIKSGMRIPKELCSFLEDMEAIKRSSPELYSLISEIKFVRKGHVDFEVLLYPRSYKTRIRIGSSLDEKMLKYIIMVLDVVSDRPGLERLEEIDFRTGDLVYRIQGE